MNERLSTLLVAIFAGAAGILGVGAVTGANASQASPPNVVVHVDAPMTLRAICLPERIRIEVDDTSNALPRLLNPDEDALRGRGIMLVDSLATDWGTELHATGKTVWFEIDIRTATEEVHGKPPP
jgi:hypothetical protein